MNYNIIYQELLSDIKNSKLNFDIKESLNDIYNEKLSSTAGALGAYTSPDMANYMAEYSLYGELIEQANLWAFIDSFRIFSICCLVIIPLLLLIKTQMGHERDKKRQAKS